MNVLFTSVGRRDYLVQYFQAALAPVGGRVHAVNSHELSAGLWTADAPAIAPPIYDPGYVDFLFGYCRTHRIDLVIPLIDLDLPVLAAAKARFAAAGITVLVAAPWVVEIASDKWATHQFLQQHGFATRPMFLSRAECEAQLESGAVRFPIFVKPRWGMGSLCVQRADDRRELEFYDGRVRKDLAASVLRTASERDPERALVFHEALPGTEHSMDIVNDLDGNYQTTLMRRKLARTAGETDAVATVAIPALEAAGRRLGELLRHPAAMDVDLFYDGTTVHILELNARFGGSYPFSHAAGADLPRAIVRWYRGEPMEVTRLLAPRIGVKSSKGYSIVAVRRDDGGASSG